MKNVLTIEGRVAIVTGATNGIGRAIAMELAAGGMKVVVAGRDKKRAEAVMNDITKNKGNAICVVGDLVEESTLKKIIEQTVKTYGQIDVLVNCAGVLTASPIDEVNREEWDLIMRTNLESSFFLIQKVIPYLEKSSAGRIINISSNAGRMGGYENSQAYTASKGGLIAITMGIARQLAPKGVTVNVVCPGTTRSDMSDLYDAEKKKRLLSRIPIGRFVEPEEVAAAVCYFASEEAGSVTGAILDINGGMYMG